MQWKKNFNLPAAILVCLGITVLTPAETEAYVRVCAWNFTAGKSECSIKGNRGTVCDSQTCDGLERCTCSAVTLANPSINTGRPRSFGQPRAVGEPIRSPWLLPTPTRTSQTFRQPRAARGTVLSSSGGLEIAIRSDGRITAGGQPLAHIDELRLTAESTLSAQVVTAARPNSRNRRAINETRITLLVVETGGNRRWHAYEISAGRAPGRR